MTVTRLTCSPTGEKNCHETRGIFHGHSVSEDRNLRGWGSRFGSVRFANRRPTVRDPPNCGPPCYLLGELVKVLEVRADGVRNRIAAEVKLHLDFSPGKNREKRTASRLQPLHFRVPWHACATRSRLPSLGNGGGNI